MVKFFYFFVIIPFSFAYYFFGGKKLVEKIIRIDIIAVTADLKKPNIVWRLNENSSIDEYDVVNKKILRTIPESTKELLSDDYTKLYVTAKFIILYDPFDVINVFNRQDLSLYCSKKNIGKLFNEPNMKISDFSLENQNIEIAKQYFKVTNEFGIIKFYNPKANMIFDNEKSLNTFAKKQDSIKYTFMPLNDSLFIKKNFEKAIFNDGYYYHNQDFALVYYKHDLMKNSSNYIALLDKNKGLVWRKSLGSLITKSKDITEAQFKYTLFGILPEKTIHNGNYLFLESKYGFRPFDNDSNVQKGNTTIALNLKTGKELWTYNWFFEESDYDPNPGYVPL